MKPEDLSIEELERLLKSKKSNADQAEADASERVSVSEDFTVDRPNNNIGRKSPVKAKQNTWSDDGSEFNDISTPDLELTPRARPKPKKVEKSCHVCGKKFKIHSSLVSGEFPRCNKCTGR